MGAWATLTTALKTAAGRMFGISGAEGAAAAALRDAQDLEKSRRGGGSYNEGDEFQHSVIEGGAYKLLPEWEQFGSYEGVRRHPMDRDQTSATFDMMRRMSHVWVIQAIIRTRVNQARRFTKVSDGRFQPGYRVVTRDPDEENTPAVQKRCTELEDFVQMCGFKERPPDQFPRPRFPYHIARCIEDSMTLDAVAIQLWPGSTRKYPISEFQAVDAAEIRKTVPTLYETGTARDVSGAKEKPPKYAHFVQMRNGRPIAEFGSDDLIYVTRNSSTWLERHEYGMGELEVLIRVVTGLLFGMEYNVRYFQQSTLPRGFISLVGQYGQAQLEYFRQQWRAMLAGIRNAHRIPIMAMREGQGAQWQPMDMSNRDMEFGSWIEFLVNCACMVYLIHPEEIGFRGWSQQKPSLSEGSPVAQLEYGSDKGLVGLLEAIVEEPMDEIIRRIDPDFKFVLVGTKQEEFRTWAEMTQLLWGFGLLTPNQIAAELDRDKIDDKEMWGDAPLGNPQAFALWQQSRGLNQQPMTGMEPMMGAGGPGMPGGPGGGPGGDQGMPGGGGGPDADMSGEEALRAMRGMYGVGGSNGAGPGDAEKSLISYVDVVLDATK